MMKKKLMARLLGASTMLLGSAAALASGEGGLDYSTLTDSVNFDDVGPAVLVAAGALVGIYVIVKGIKMIIGFVRS